MGSLDKFRAQQILQRGRSRKATEDEQIMGSSDNVFIIPGEELGKIMKIHFKKDQKTAEQLKDALGGFDGGVVKSVPYREPFSFELDAAKLQEIAGEQARRVDDKKSGKRR